MDPTPQRPAGRSSRAGVRTGRWPAAVFSAPLLGLLIMPVLVLLARTSGTTLFDELRQPATLQAITLSIWTSMTTVGVTVVFGMPVALLLSRGPFRGRTLLDVFIDLPTVLPPAAAGIALLLALGRNGVAGPALRWMGISLPFTPAAVVLAQTFVAAPYFIKTAAVALANVSDELYEAAALDGASAMQAFWHVTVPVAWRGLAGGAALCWARALGEFGATIIFAGNYPGRTQTMPLAIYMGFEIDLPQALALAAVLLAVSFTLLLAVRVGPRRDWL